MAHWKRRRPPTSPAAEGAAEDTEALRRDLAWREEEIHFLRAQLAQAIAGWREAQQQIFAMEASGEEAGGATD